MIVHHSGHNGEIARGNSTFYAALDAKIFLRKTRNDITATCTKMKDAPNFEDLNFPLDAQDLEIAGVEFQTCYLQEVTNTERPPRLSPNQKLALDTLLSGTKGSVQQASLHLEA